jgi:hypothetical protein
MTTYEKCGDIRRVIVNQIGVVLTNPHWGPEYQIKQVLKLPEAIIPQVAPIEIGELTNAEMDDLGFGRWDAKDTKRLIPIWLFPFLPDKITSTNPWGKVETLDKASMDTDCCYGWMAYGVWPKDCASHCPENLSKAA